MSVTLVWFRRDLRTLDHTALQTAIRRGLPVVGVYVFDTDTLDQLPENDRRLSFIHDCLNELHQNLARKNIPLWVLHGRAETEIARLAAHLHAAAVVCAEEYEPQAFARDNRIWRNLDAAGRPFIRVTDHVLRAKSDVMTQQGRPYTTFTAYKKAWLASQKPSDRHWRPQDDWANLAQQQRRLPKSARQMPALPSLAQLGLSRRHLLLTGGETAAQSLLNDFLPNLSRYHIERDFPAKKELSLLAPHMRFGTVSIRQLMHLAQQEDNNGATAWLNELIQRDFYHQFLYHHPHVIHESFRPEYRHLEWENNQNWFERWKAGQTGYPIIDAAMRQLARSGFLHSRLRLIAAGFLVKGLLIDWRWGEAWFAAQLLDFDLALNNGYWQYVTGSGGEVPSVARIANPVIQSQKFDPEGVYIKRHVPELAHLSKDIIHAPWLAQTSVNIQHYPTPVVNHEVQRAKALALFQPHPSKPLIK